MILGKRDLGRASGNRYPHLDLEVEEGQQLTANWCPGKTIPCRGVWGSLRTVSREVGGGEERQIGGGGRGSRPEKIVDFTPRLGIEVKHEAFGWI